MGGLDSSGPGGLRQHHARLLSGGGVDVVVAEENLRSLSAGSAVLGHVVGTDVDCGGGGLFDHLDGGNLAVGTAHTVGLAFGCFDDHEDAAVVGRSLIQLEGEGFTPAHDGGRGRVLYTHESGRVGLRSAAAGDNPVVQTGEEVRTEIFPLVPRTLRASWLRASLARIWSFVRPLHIVVRRLKTPLAWYAVRTLPP